MKGRESKAFTGLTAQKTIYLEACPKVTTPHLGLINSFMTLVQRRKFCRRFLTTVQTEHAAGHLRIQLRNPLTYSALVRQPFPKAS